jgi:hypothetical protein
MLMKVEPSQLGSEKKQESILFKYARFVKLIKEAGENEEGEESVSEKIKTYFNENLEIDDYLILEEEAKKIESEIEKGVQSPKFLVISGMNPIIEIVRIFNRAYKIHTTSTIPVGTTDGKVKASTWSEYTAFGYNSGAPSATEDGPYRNNKIFNMWEDAVMDVLSNTKYAPIFAAQTKIEDGSGNIKEGAGVALRQMMLDFLDGDGLAVVADHRVFVAYLEALDLLNGCGGFVGALDIGRGRHGAGERSDGGESEQVGKDGFGHDVTLGFSLSPGEHWVHRK